MTSQPAIRQCTEAEKEAIFESKLISSRGVNVIRPEATLWVPLRHRLAGRGVRHSDRPGTRTSRPR
jgi:hypothetical protein